MTFENAVGSEIGRCVLSFLRIDIILVIFHVVGRLLSVNDWLICLSKMYQVASGALLTFE